jgi:hypothetical protein
MATRRGSPGPNDFATSTETQKGGLFEMAMLIEHYRRQLFQGNGEMITRVRSRVLSQEKLGQSGCWQFHQRYQAVLSLIIAAVVSDSANFYRSFH